MPVLIERSGGMTSPVCAGRGKDGLTPDRLGGPVEGVGCRAPDRVVWRGAMRLERGLIRVYLVEVVDVLVPLVLENVEAEACGLVALRAEGVHLDRLQETLSQRRLDPHLHPDREHAASL